MTAPPCLHNTAGRTSLGSDPNSLATVVSEPGIEEAQVAAAAFLAGYNGRTLDAYRCDLRTFLQWAVDVSLPSWSRASSAPSAQGQIGNLSYADLDSVPVLGSTSASHEPFSGVVRHTEL